MSLVIITRILVNLQRDLAQVQDLSNRLRDTLEREELLAIVRESAVKGPCSGEVTKGDRGGGCHSLVGWKWDGLSWLGMS